MAEFRLRGKTYELEEMSFEAVERAWPYISEATINPDPMAGVSAGISVIAAACIEQDWFKPDVFEIDVPEDLFVNRDDFIFDALRKKLKRMVKSSEIGDIRLCVVQMTQEAGLMPEEGEAKPVVTLTAERGTETSTASLPSSSPLESKAETGIE